MKISTTRYPFVSQKSINVKGPELESENGVFIIIANSWEEEQESNAKNEGAIMKIMRKK
jgi:hypothetical protein